MNQLFSANFLVIYLAFISFFGAFFTVLIVTPFLIERMKKRNIVGIDLNKFDKPKIPEMGGISVFFGLTFGIMVVLGFFRIMSLLYGSIDLNVRIILAGFLTIIIVGFIGIFDDLIGWKNGIRKWQHALFPLFAAMPLMVLPENILATTIQVPFFGSIYVGILYSIVLIPLAITGASNAVNMLAGLNGLEAGLGSIISFTMILALLLLPDASPGKTEALVLACATLGAILAFLKFNWFPAKIFGGDSLTLMIGASIASVSIIAGIEMVGLLLFGIYFVELVVKAKHKMQSECFGIPQKDGTLKARPEGGSITQWIMRRGKFTEKKVVLIILAIQAGLSFVVLGLFYLKIL